MTDLLKNHPKFTLAYWMGAPNNCSEHEAQQWLVRMRGTEEYNKLVEEVGAQKALAATSVDSIAEQDKWAADLRAKASSANITPPPPPAG